MRLRGISGGRSLVPAFDDEGRGGGGGGAGSGNWLDHILDFGRWWRQGRPWSTSLVRPGFPTRSGVMVWTMPGDRGFRDRLSERQTLEGLLRDARGGRSSVLVVRGEAGIGKIGAGAGDRCAGRLASTSLRSPGSSRRWSCRSRDSISSSHRCSAGSMALPPPQERALRVALGLASGDAARPFPRRPRDPDPPRRGRRRRAVPLHRRRRPVAGRRIPPGPRVRGPTAPRGARGARLRRARAELGSTSSPACRSSSSTGLDDEDARALLATVIPGRIDDRVRDRIVAETRGNPLALLELPRGLSPAELAGGFGMPDLVPLSGRIEESFLRRLDELPEQTRLLLLRRGGGARRRPGPDVARCEAAGHPAHDGRARGTGRAARRRRAGSLPASAGAVGRLSIGVGRRAPERARSVGRGDRRRARAGPPRLAPGAGRRRARTRRSPTSSSGPPAARRPAAASPPRRRSWAARPT